MKLTVYYATTHEIEVEVDEKYSKLLTNDDEGMLDDLVEDLYDNVFPKDIEVQEILGIFQGGTVIME